MDILQSYLEEIIQINPVINDFFCYEKFKQKKHIQPDIYSEKFYQNILKVDQKYCNILKKKKNYLLMKKYYFKN